MAALRLWGQTGVAPGGWVAAADPVYLEPMLDHLRLHELRHSELSVEERHSIFEHIRQTLGDGERPVLSCTGGYGYLHASDEFATACVPAAAVDGSRPDPALPQGDSAADHDRLLSEIQMCLHSSAVNEARAAAGTRPANSLWLWGGGYAAQQAADDLPALFSDDPLFRGHWHSHGGTVSDWPGDISACIATSRTPVVVVLPTPQDEIGAPRTEAILKELEALMHAGRLPSLLLLFGDGSEVRLRRFDRFRFWRTSRALPGDAQ
jgi:hypothetical protein